MSDLYRHYRDDQRCEFCDDYRAVRALRDGDSGILAVNAGTIGAENQLPLEGTKAAGNGHREAGTAALDVLSDWQALYIDAVGVQ